MVRDQSEVIRPSMAPLAFVVLALGEPESTDVTVTVEISVDDANDEGETEGAELNMACY